MLRPSWEPLGEDWGCKVLRKRSITQTKTLTWAASNAAISQDIDQVGQITQIDVTVEITPSATLGGANQPDGLWRPIKNLAIKGSSHTYIQLPVDDACGGGILLHYLNMYDFPSRVFHYTGSVTAPLGRAYTPLTSIIHCGTRPTWNGKENKFDLSAFIPAYAESQLAIEWATGPNSVMDDTVTISSATMRVTLHYVTGRDAEIRAEMAAQGVLAAMCPAWMGQVDAHDAAYTDYQDEINIPTGAYLARIADLEQDATATRAIRAADEASGFAVKLNNDETLFKVYADAVGQRTAMRGTNMVADDAAPQFQGEAPVGIYILDLKDHGTTVGEHGNPLARDYGVNLIGVPQGLPKLGRSVAVYASGDDSLIIWERYLPFQMVSGLQGKNLDTP